MTDRTERYRIWLVLLIIGGMLGGFVAFGSGERLRGSLFLAVAAVATVLFLAGPGSTN